MKRFAAVCLPALLGVVLVANAPPAAALEYSFESRTYLEGFGVDGGDTHAPLYEYLALDVFDFAGPGFYVRAGGWGRVDLADETYGRTSNGDLQYGFIGWRGPTLNSEARLGRVSLSSGVARNEIFDGLLVGSDLPYGFDVTAFGGVPVETDEGGRSDDLLYGGRVSQGKPGLYRIGASYLKEENDGDDFREEAGADVFVAPLPYLEITGSSLYNLITEDWARHDYRVALGPFLKSVRLAATWADTDYRSYFQSPVNPAFVQVEPDADEQLTRIGAEVDVLLDGGFRLSADYANYGYDDAGDAQAWGLGADWAGSGYTAGLAYRTMDGDEEENRYQLLSGYVTGPIGPVRASLSGEYLRYDEEINDEDSSMTGALSFAYSLGPTLEITATGQYGVSPLLDPEVKGIFAVLWRYDAVRKKGGTP